MKIAVLNGSPRGKYSTTIYSALYLQKKFKNDEFQFMEVASAIRNLEKDISPLIKVMTAADIILFAYPVYTFMAPYQLHRAIELIKASGVTFKGKYMAQITTSKHFYDVTAQNFIRQNAEDLGMTYLKGFYADMDDLPTKKGQNQLVSFWEYVHFLYDCKNGNNTEQENIETGFIAIITDCMNDAELSKSIDNFREACKIKTRIVNLNDLNLKGGCTGCLNCAKDGTCIYNDGFSDFLKNNIFNATALVYAFRIRDHSMGSTFKLYDDRQFCNGHRIITAGKPIGYIVEGDISQESNLKMIIEGRAETGCNLLCGIADDSRDLTVKDLADRLVFTINHKTSLPQNFYGVGGSRIFRDLVWTMRGIMRADHKYYKSHGIYKDLPHRQIGKLLNMELLGSMFNNKKLRRKMGSRMNEGMVAPYKKVINEK